MSQCLQGKGFTAKWMRLCRFRSWLRLKLCGQVSHLNGRSCVDGGCGPPYICCICALCPLLKANGPWPGMAGTDPPPMMDTLVPCAVWMLDIIGPIPGRAYCPSGAGKARGFWSVGTGNGGPWEAVGENRVGALAAKGLCWTGEASEENEAAKWFGCGVGAECGAG